MGRRGEEKKGGRGEGEMGNREKLGILRIVSLLYTC
jgi:hypothetical protein